MSVNLNGDLSQWTMGANAAPDMFRMHDTSAAVHTIVQSTDVPARTLCGRVIPYSMEVTVTTADTSIGSSDVTALVYRGEGSEVCRLAGGPVRVRGWFKGLAGTYNLHLSNGAETLSYSQPILFSTSDMWTRFDVWFPELPDFDGSWYTNYRVGYTVALALCAGSGLQDEMEQWVSGLKFGAAPTNFNATVGNKIKIAGLRVGDGPLFTEPAEITEQACMRYLEKSFDRSTTPGSGTTGFGTGELRWQATVAGAAVQDAPPMRYAVPKRIVPAMIGYNPVTVGSSQARAVTAGDCTGTTFTEKTAYGFRGYTTSPAGTAVRENIALHWLADASLPALTTSIGG